MLASAMGVAVLLVFAHQFALWCVRTARLHARLPAHTALCAAQSYPSCSFSLAAYSFSLPSIVPHRAEA